MTEETVGMVLQIPKELHRKLASKCSSYAPRIPQYQYLLDLLERDLKGWNPPIPQPHKRSE